MPPVPPTPAPPAGPLARWLRNPSGAQVQLLHHLAHALAAFAHALMPVAIAFVAAIAFYALIAETVRARWACHGRWIAIAPPAEPDPAGGLALWRMLHPLLTARHSPFGRRPPVAFECHADAAGLRLGLWVSPTISAAGVAKAVEAAWRGARATITTPPPLPAGARTLGGKARPAAPDWFGLGDEQTGGDPIRGVLSVLICSDPAESAVVQIVARPAAGRRVARARRTARAIRRGQPTTSVGRARSLPPRRGWLAPGGTGGDLHRGPPSGPAHPGAHPGLDQRGGVDDRDLSRPLGQREALGERDHGPAVVCGGSA